MEDVKTVKGRNHKYKDETAARVFELKQGSNRARETDA